MTNTTSPTTITRQAVASILDIIRYMRQLCDGDPDITTISNDIVAACTYNRDGTITINDVYDASCIDYPDERLCLTADILLDGQIPIWCRLDIKGRIYCDGRRIPIKRHIRHVLSALHTEIASLPKTTRILVTYTYHGRDILYWDPTENTVGILSSHVVKPTDSKPLVRLSHDLYVSLGWDVGPYANYYLESYGYLDPYVYHILMDRLSADADTGNDDSK